MRVCCNCFENNVMNSELKFSSNRILSQVFAYTDVCKDCEPILIEKHKEEIEARKDYEPTFLKVHYKNGRVNSGRYQGHNSGNNLKRPTSYTNRNGQH